MGLGGCAEERVCAKLGVCMRREPVVLPVLEERLVLCTTGAAADNSPEKIGSPRSILSGHPEYIHQDCHTAGHWWFAGEAKNEHSLGDAGSSRRLDKILHIQAGVWNRSRSI
ncbi:hypothetical protein HPB48_020490 [Haemaphysalis longicornis]|uniref:Uncharacterized protein n=1 Tax=Haemaphysalis longicornis TaxID=44386 RepID=A0A9J6FCN8_HAELO|nr:hypothetical protein HPB48_020490 [Haemaphysalis longicornis]